MIILGIDPGTARIGWGILESIHNIPQAKAYGLIETEKDLSPERRLEILYDALLSLLVKYKPDAVGIEDLFFSKNAKTAISVGQARGVLLLACAKKHIPVYSYNPLTVKRTITGDGKADKKQVEHMVTTILKLKVIPKPDDTADALAIALTHVYTKKYK